MRSFVHVVDDDVHAYPHVYVVLTDFVGGREVAVHPFLGVEVPAESPSIDRIDMLGVLKSPSL